MTLTTQPIKLLKSYPDEDGVLVHEGGLLVAIILHLSFIHESSEGKWFIEWAAQPEFQTDDLFASLDVAKAWLAVQISPPLTPPH